MKRILTGALAALIAFSAHAATLTPIQLLNPAGSTSGQAIVSTGATTAPAWGNVSISTLTGILPIANGGTGQSSAAAALTALGGLSTATAASTYGAKASPLSQFAATTSAQFAGVISDETGTGSVVLGTGPTINQPNLVGTTTGAAAAAGSIGETTAPTDLTLVSVASTTPANISSVSLTAGDYDISCTARWAPAAGASFASLNVSISPTSATGGNPGQRTLLEITFPAALVQEFGTPPVTVRPTSTTTYYCVQIATLAGGTATANGYMHVRRLH